MKLYDTRTAPNPRRVRVFLAEKGIEIPDVQQIDLGAAQVEGFSNELGGRGANRGAHTHA